jgi:hypothetical protein
MPHGGDVEAADEGDGAIADDQFAMVADVEAAQGKGIEPTHGSAGFPQGIPIRIGEGDGSEGIEEDADFDAALGGADEGIAQVVAGDTGLVNVDLELNELGGLIDRLTGGFEGLISGG